MSQFNSDIISENNFIDQIRSNIKSDFIQITEDKLENILLKHLKKSNKVSAWITPLSLFVTIFLVVLTADFKDFAGIEKSVWKAIFLISMVGTFIWTIIAARQAISCSKKVTVEYLIKEIKNNRDPSGC